MWSGRRFQLKEQILATEVVNSERIARYIAKGEIVTVTRGPRPDDVRLVDLLWGDRYITVFAVDLEARGDEVAAGNS